MENYTDRYFDWAATSPQDSEILHKALTEATETFANPSSIHKEGQKARAALEKARTLAANVLGVKPAQLFFTSGGTESNQIPLMALLSKPERGRVIISGIEHPAIKEQASKLKLVGFDVVTVNPDKNGFISADSVAEKITPDTLYVAVMAVNNETGCIQPIYQIADKITEASQGKRRPHFHVDCVQAAGKVPLNLAYKGIDSAALSAHKICGPRGIGILYLANHERLRPFLTGGGQEQNIRSGTENLFGALAFSEVLKKHFIAGQSDAKSVQTQRFEEQTKMTEDFISSLLQLPNCTIVPEIRANADGNTQKLFSPWIVQAAFKGIPGAVMVRALDAKGFEISTGSACSAKKQSRPVLQAMSASKDIQDTAVRFSFGPLTTAEGMKQLANAVAEICSDFS